MVLAIRQRRDFSVFESSCHLSIPARTVEALQGPHCPFQCWMSNGEAANTSFKVRFWAEPTRNRTLVYLFISRRSTHSNTGSFLPRTYESAFVQWMLLIREYVNVAYLAFENHQFSITTLWVQEKFAINVLRPRSAISCSFSVLYFLAVLRILLNFTALHVKQFVKNYQQK